VNDKRSIPSKRDLEELRRIAKDCNLTYTAHMPLDINLGSGVENKRKSSIDKVVSLMNHLYTLKPYSYIFHLNLTKVAEKNIKRWRDRVNDSLRGVLRKTECSSKKISIENLDYHFRYIEDIVVKIISQYV